MRITIDETDEATVRLADALAREIRIEAYPPEGLRLDFRDPFENHLGLALRKSEAKRRVLAALTGLARGSWIDDVTLLAVCDAAASVDGIVARCAHALILPATRALTPRQVLAAIPITPRERLRWTKDGRMPRSGSVMIRRAQLIALATYAVDMISALAADPSIIERWRIADAAAAPSTGEAADRHATG